MTDAERTEITNFAADQVAMTLLDDLAATTGEADELIILAATYGPAITH